MSKSGVNRRLAKELKDLQENKPDGVSDIEPNEQNMNEWVVLLIPMQPPYNKGAFKIVVNFPAEYPFKPPKVTFKTNIYHPNVDDKGQVCLPIISPEHWKPATKTEQVLDSLLKMIHEPEPDHPLRGDLAEEYQTDRKLFNKKAEEQTKRNALKRPSD